MFWIPLIILLVLVLVYGIIGLVIDYWVHR